MMKYFYITSTMVICGFHIHSTFHQDIESPLSLSLILLLLTPLTLHIWKDAKSLKLGAKGLEFERLNQDAEKAISNVAAGNNIDSSSLEKLFRSTNHNSWLKLVLTRMLMRKGLALLIPNHKLGDAPSLEKLIDQCESDKLISTEEKASLNKIRRITFYAEWWHGEKPTKEEWRWAENNCEEIVKSIFDKQPIH